jgi:cytochrome P450 family 110
VIDRKRLKYGDYFAAKILGFSKFVVVSDPEAVAAIFAAPPQQFNSSAGNHFLKPLLGEQGLLLLDGERHQRHRQLLMPPFHGERMRVFGEIIREITLEQVNQWSNGQTFCLRPKMQEISLHVILKAVFGVTEPGRLEQFKTALTLLLEVATSPVNTFLIFFPFLQLNLGSWSPMGRFLQLRQRVDELIYAEIADRLQNPDPDRTDILTLLLQARDSEGQPMSDLELRDELMTLLIAGHETTATALSWAFYWIYRLPIVHEKLLAELEFLGTEPEPTETTKLPYLSAVCSETLRIFPIAFIAHLRILNQPFALQDYQFSSGTTLVANIYSIHHRPDLYPESKQFRPERFLERQFSPGEYLPFGGGSRRCIGAAFALFEMKTVLSTILSHCQLELRETKPVQAIRRGVFLGPASGLQVSVQSKNLLATSNRD